MNRGGGGAQPLNIELQAALNPVKRGAIRLTFAPGDKVMQLENDYDKEYNGDMDSVDASAGELVAGFDGRPVSYGFGELDMLGARVRGNHSQEPGLGIFRRDHPVAHAALCHAAAESSLHRRHAWQAAGRAGRPEEGGPEEGGRHRRA